VAFIMPRAQRIWLAAPTELVGSEARLEPKTRSPTRRA
jgi:hypothetical protein